MHLILHPIMCPVLPPILYPIMRSIMFIFDTIVNLVMDTPLLAGRKVTSFKTVVYPFMFFAKTLVDPLVPDMILYPIIRSIMFIFMFTLDTIVNLVMDTPLLAGRKVTSFKTVVYPFMFFAKTVLEPLAPVADRSLPIRMFIHKPLEGLGVVLF